MSWLGDFKLGDTFDTKFTTAAAGTGAPTTLAGSPVISAYVGNSTTELTAGITLTVDFDSRTGMHNVRVVATTGNGYAAATNYQLVLTAGTVGGTSVVGYVIGEFSVENRVVNIASTPTLTGPYAAFGIAESGTSQASSGTTVTLRSATEVFADNDLNGMTIWVRTGSRWESRAITGYVAATKIATVDVFATAPSGAVPYIVFGTAPLSSIGVVVDAASVRAAIGQATPNLDTTLTAISNQGSNLQTRIPAALTNGRIASDVQSVAGIVVQTSGTSTQNIGGP